MALVTELISIVNAWLIGLLGFVSESITGIVELFYDSSADKLTILGVLALMGLAMVFVRIGIRFVTRFFVK